MAAPVVATVGTIAQGDGVGSLASNAPASVASGDLLVLCVSVALAQTITTPDGWDSIATAADGFGNTRAQMFRRIADGGANDTPTVSLTSGTRDMASVMLRITGNSATPYDTSNTGSQTTGAAIAVPSITTSEADELLIFFAAIDGVWHASPDPTDWGQEALVSAANPQFAALGVWSRTAATATTYGGETATLTGNNQASTVVAAFKAAAAGGTNPKGVFGMALDGPFRRVVY